MKYVLGVISLILILTPALAYGQTTDNLWKFDSGFYEKILKLQNEQDDTVGGESDYTHSIIMITDDGQGIQTEQFLYELGAQNIFRSEILDFLIADVSLNKTMDLAGYDFIYKIGDGQKDTVSYLATSFYPEIDKQIINLRDAKRIIGAGSIPSDTHPYTGKSIIIGVIDTLVDFTHPDLSGKNVAKKTCGAVICVDNSSSTAHGTEIVGASSANSTNDLNDGVAPDSEIFNISLRNDTALNESTTESVSHFARSVHELLSNDIRIGFSSRAGSGNLGCNDYDVLAIIMDRAVNSGLSFSTAIGNKGTLNPSIQQISCGFNYISVGAIDKNGNIWNRSSKGPAQFNIPSGDIGRIKPEIVAPGKKIIVPTPFHSNRDGTSHAYASGSGNSISNGFIAGTGALILEKQPDYDPLKIKAAMLVGADWKAMVPATATDYDNRQSGIYDTMNEYGFGILNVERSLDYSNNDRFPNILDGTMKDRTPYRIHAEQGDHVKVLLSWFIHPRGTVQSPDLPFNTPFSPITGQIHNYDLRVSFPNGRSMSSASSAQNNEFVVFEAPTTGAYTISVISSGAITVANEPFVIASTHPIDKAPFDADFVPPSTTDPSNAPSITGIPDTIRAKTTGFGINVTYRPPTVDRGVISCTPESGSFFRTGTTTVTCTAEYNGATSTATFDVIVTKRGGGGGGGSNPGTPVGGRPVISVLEIPKGQSSGQTITLDASSTTGSSNLVFEWRQERGNSPVVRLENKDTAVATFQIPYATMQQNVSLRFTITVSDGTASDIETVTVPVILMPQPPIVIPPRVSTPGFAEIVLFEEQWDRKSGDWVIDSEWEIQRPNDPLPVDTNNKVIHIEECDDSCPIQIDEEVELYTYDGADLTFWVWFGDEIGNSDSLDIEAAMVQIRTPGGWEDKHMIMVGQSDYERWFPVTVNFDEFGRDDFFFRFVPMLQDDDSIIELDAIKIIGKKRDSIKPVFSGIPDAINRTVSGPSVISYTPPTARDNIDGEVPVMCDLSSGIVFPIGATTITCTATDSARNIATASFDVILSLDTGDDTPDVPIRDTTPPAISGISRAIALDLEGDTVPNPVQPTATDLVDGTIIPVCEPASGAALGLGTHIMTCTATDASGNMATRQGVIHVSSDNPSIHGVGDTGTAIIGPTYIHLVFDPVQNKTGYKCVIWTDDYDSRELTFANGTLCSFNSLDVETTYAVNVVPKGRMQTAIFQHTDLTTGTLPDTISPVITAPSDITAEATAHLTALDIGTATATDLEDTDPRITSNSTGSFPLGATVIKWTAIDLAGNMATAHQLVTIQDTTPPVLSGVLRAVSVEIGSNPTYKNPADPSAMDLADGAITPDCDMNLDGQLAPGTYTIACTATDSSGNTAGVQGFIQITSMMPTTTFELGAGTAIAGSDYVHLVFDPIQNKTGYKCVIWTDSYDDRILTFTNSTLCTYDRLDSDSEYAVNVVPRGAGQRSIFPYTELSTTPEFTLPPNESGVRIIAPPDIITTTKTQHAKPDIGNAIAIGLNPAITNDAPARFPIGNTTVTWSATDENGGTDTDTQLVTIQKYVYLTLTEVPDMHIISETPVRVNYTIPVAIGHPNATIACNPGSGELFPVRSNVVICTGIDQAGRQATEKFTVNIVPDNRIILYEDFADLNGWEFSEFEQSTRAWSGYSANLSDYGNPAPSALITGDGHDLRTVLSRNIPLDHYNRDDRLELQLEHNIFDSRNVMVYDAYFEIRSDMGFRLYQCYFNGPHTHAGWNVLKVDLTDQLDYIDSIWLDLIMFDYYLHDAEQEAYFDNVYLRSVPPSVQGEVGHDDRHCGGIPYD